MSQDAERAEKYAQRVLILERQSLDWRREEDFLRRELGLAVTGRRRAIEMTLNSVLQRLDGVAELMRTRAWEDAGAALYRVIYELGEQLGEETSSNEDIRPPLPHHETP